MKLLIIFLAANLWAANYNCTSTGTGDFNAAGTWASCNSTYPNNSTDTFTFSIGATHDVTIPAGVEITIGQSLAANTAQGTTATTGQLILTAGGATDPTILTMKGDLAITTVTASCTLDGATNCNGVEMNPGTVLLIDSDGSGTAYAIGQTANGNSRWFKADCTDATSMPAWAGGTTYQRGYRVSYGGVNYISLTNSNTGNTPDMFVSTHWMKGNCLIMSIGATNAVFGFRGFSSGGGNVYLRNVAVQNLGTSSVAAFSINTQVTNNPAGGFDVENCSFDSIGHVAFGGDSSTASKLFVSNSIAKNSINTNLRFIEYDSSSTANSTGLREFSENVLLGQMLGQSSTHCKDCIIDGNYVETPLASFSGINWTGSTSGRAATRVVGNFVLKYPTTQTPINVQTPLVEYNYVVNGYNTTNQNSISLTTAATTNTAATASYNMIGLLNGDTTGDAYVVTQASNANTLTFSRNGTELNRDNTTSGNMFTDLGIATPGGTDNHIYKNNFHYSTNSLLHAETSEHWAGSVTLQNNTVALHSGTTTAKFVDTNSCVANPNDMCSAAQCNYNLGVALNRTPAGGCTNAHNFYHIDLSAASGWGANDIDLTTVAEAQFVDLTRTFATAASDWLGHTATAWSNASVSYAVGDIVSDSQSIWQGKTVLYRALAAHTSADTSRPGNGATWTTACGGGPCWEYATAYYLRDLIARGTRITDASIGASNDFVPKAMALWALHGRVSHRRDLQCMGNDGESPWPIPRCEQGRAVAAAISGF